MVTWGKTCRFPVSYGFDGGTFWSWFLFGFLVFFLQVTDTGGSSIPSRQCKRVRRISSDAESDPSQAPVKRRRGAAAPSTPTPTAPPPPPPPTQPPPVAAAVQNSGAGSRAEPAPAQVPNVFWYPESFQWNEVGQVSLCLLRNGPRRRSDVVREMAFHTFLLWIFYESNFKRYISTKHLNFFLNHVLFISTPLLLFPFCLNRLSSRWSRPRRPSWWTASRNRRICSGRKSSRRRRWSTAPARRRIRRRRRRRPASSSVPACPAPSSARSVDDVDGRPRHQPYIVGNIHIIFCVFFASTTCFYGPLRCRRLSTRRLVSVISLS